MKINKEVVRRLEAAEKKLESIVHPKFVVMDFDGRYFGGCGFDLSQEQFDVWLKDQGATEEVVIMKYTNNEGNPLRKIAQNNLEKEQNTHDLESEGKK